MNETDPASDRVLDGDLRDVAAQIVSKYPNKRSAVLPLLFLAQSVEGYVTEAGMREVAGILGLTPAEVLASGSFYSMIKKRPQGDYLISVCRNISCTHLGARKLISALADHLEIGPGETTPDGKFTFETAECLATCDGAPSMQVNYEDFYTVSPDDAIGTVEALRRGDEVRSVRGEPVKTAKEIAYETATAGLKFPAGPPGKGRTVGGESPRRDTAPGFRPKESGADG